MIAKERRYLALVELVAHTPTGDGFRVQYQIPAEESLRILNEAHDPVTAGKFVFIAARVKAVERKGGYEKTGIPPGCDEPAAAVRRELETELVTFSFEPSEIFLLLP